MIINNITIYEGDNIIFTLRLLFIFTNEDNTKVINISPSRGDYRLGFRVGYSTPGGSAQPIYERP